MKSKGKRELEFKAFGSHYDVGYTIGKFHKEHVKAVFSKYFEDTIVSFYKTTNGGKICRQFLENTELFYPHLVEEMKGMAEGLAVDFVWVLLFNMQDEIRILMRTKPYRFNNVYNLNFTYTEDETSESESDENGTNATMAGDGCSTLCLKSMDECVIVHNEDVMHELMHTGAFVEAHVYPNPNQTYTEIFYAFTLPGLLPGKGPCFNKTGLVSCSNTVLPRNIDASAIPSKIISRAFLSAKSIAEVIQIATSSPGIASGASVTIGNVKSEQKELVNIEFYASSDGIQYNKNEIKAFDFHFDEYIKSHTVPYFTDHSSQGRLLCLETVLRKSGRPKTVQDLLAIISVEAEDFPFPLYRNGHYPDPNLTVLTVQIDIQRGWLEAYTENPQSSTVRLTKNMSSL